MKPRIRPIRFGEVILWECRAQRLIEGEGWVWTELYGKRGHGYTPMQAHEDWKQQSVSGCAPSAAQYGE